MAAGAALVALVVPGCSSEQPVPEVAGGTGADNAKPQDDNAVRKAWVDCMHKQGQTSVQLDKDNNISVPAAGTGTGTDTGLAPGYETASKLCDEKVPGIHQAKRANIAKFVEMSRKWVVCARENGYPDMPDPDPQTAIVTIPRAVFDGAKWDKATQVCNPRFPMAGFRIGD